MASMTVSAGVRGAIVKAIERRVRAYRKQSEANQNRRGPKPKVTPSASDHERHATD